MDTSVISVRIRQQHRKCGYCSRELQTATALRRHVRQTPGHEIYHNFLRLLHEYGEPLSLGTTSDLYDRAFNTSLKEKEKEKENGEAETRPVAPLASESQIPREELREELSALAHVRALGYATLFAALSRASLASLERCPSSVRAIWEGVGGMPLVFASSRIYYSERRHQDRTLFGHYLSSTQIRIFKDGVEDSQQRPSNKKEMIHDLAWSYRDHTPGDPRISASFCLKGDDLLDIPRLANDPIAEKEEETEVILTTKGGITDLHVGMYRPLYAEGITKLTLSLR